MPFDPVYGSMEDDELLSLARASGVLSSENAPQPSPEIEENQFDYDMESDPSTGERQDFHTWVPAQKGYTPAYEAPPAPSTNLLPPGVNSQATSSSQRGFQGGKYEEVKGKEGDLNRDLAAADAYAQASGQRMLDTAQMGAQSGYEAEKALANAQVEKINHQGEEALVFQRLQDEFAAEEAKMNAEAQGLANQAKADYMTALADFRASKVNPAQLWQNMSGGDRFGTLVTAFVHDFLGAKGINTSAMATFNKAVDRNIEAQIHAIKTKGEVAEGFKSLWWMQRNQSQSDTEARARVRGFLLEGAKQAAIASMAPYESALASAQGKAAIAKIDEELAKTLIEVYRHTDSNAVALRNQALEKWRIKVQAALESHAQSLRQQEIDLAKKGQAGPGIEPIYNPETGEAEWYFQPWVTEEERKKTRAQMEALDNLNEDFKDLRELARSAESIADPLARTRFQNTITKKMDSISTRMAHNFAKANEERATNEDVQDFLKGMPLKTWLTQADVDQIIAFTHDQMIRPSMSKIKTVAFDLPKEMRPQFGRAASGMPFAGARTDAKNTSKPPTPTADEFERSQILEGLANKHPDMGARDLVDEPSSEVKNAHKEAIRQYPHLFGEQTHELKGQGGYTVHQYKAPKAILGFEKHMVDLRRLARKGDKKALEALQAQAGPYLNGVSEDDQSVFAAMMINSLDDEE